MTEPKNHEYFRKLRRTNPSEYFSPRVQKELMRQAMRQGDSFYEKAPSPTPDDDLFDDFDEDISEGEDR